MLEVNNFWTFSHFPYKILLQLLVRSSASRGQSSLNPHQVLCSWTPLGHSPRPPYKLALPCLPLLVHQFLSYCYPCSLHLVYMQTFCCYSNQKRDYLIGNSTFCREMRSMRETLLVTSNHSADSYVLSLLPMSLPLLPRALEVIQSRWMCRGFTSILDWTRSLPFDACMQ